MELALTLPKYFLILSDSEERVAIVEPRVLDYFRTFIDSLYRGEWFYHPKWAKPLKVCRSHRHAVLLTSVGFYGAGAAKFGALGKRDRDVLVVNWSEYSYDSLFTRKEIKSIFVGPYQTFVALYDGSLMMCGYSTITRTYEFVKVSLSHRPSSVYPPQEITHTLSYKGWSLYVWSQ